VAYGLAAGAGGGGNDGDRVTEGTRQHREPVLLQAARRLARSPVDLPQRMIESEHSSRPRGRVRVGWARSGMGTVVRETPTSRHLGGGSALPARRPDGSAVRARATRISDTRSLGGGWQLGHLHSAVPLSEQVSVLGRGVRRRLWKTARTDAGLPRPARRPICSIGSAVVCRSSRARSMRASVSHAIGDVPVSVRK
jgi:hypothetical protein